MKKIYLFLFLIFFLAASLRFYNLASIPVGFHIDEGSLGYNAYSLLLTGKDSNGNFLPFYISMFGDNNPSGYYYLALLPISFFGLNEFAVRFPAALIGSLSIFAIYLLAFAIFNDKRIGLLSGLFVAVAPWSVVLSRTSAETLVALFFVVLGFALVILSIKTSGLKFLFGGVASLMMSFLIYPAPRIFVPLLFIALLCFLPKWFKKSFSKYKLFLLSSFLLLGLFLVFLIFIVPGGTERFKQVSIFNAPETQLVAEEQIREDGVKNVQVPIVRFYHNKIINYTLTFFGNYFEYFSGNFLFLKGGLPLLLHVPHMGLLYLIQLPFFLIGLVLLATHKNKYYKVPLIWLILAPFVASLTMDDSPNVRRALIMFPAIELIVAYGFFAVLDYYSGIKKKVIFLIAGLLFVFNISYFIHQYFIHAQIHRTWYRNNGFKAMIKEVMTNSANYDGIVLTKNAGGNGPLTLFFTKYDPTTYHQEGSPGDVSYKGFGKFIFVPQDCPSVERDKRYSQLKHIIFVDMGTCPDNELLSKRKYKYIYREDGTKIYRVVYD